MKIKKQVKLEAKRKQKKNTLKNENRKCVGKKRENI